MFPQGGRIAEFLNRAYAYFEVKSGEGRQMADAVVKVFVRTGSHYVMSRKRAPGRTADGRLEHLGGHMQAGETAIDAMVREAREEECTGRLAALLEQVCPQPRRVEVGHDTQPHFLFDLTVDESEARTFVADSKESYGFELIPAERLDTDNGLAQMSDVLTPKTMAIYRALGRHFRAGSPYRCPSS